MKNNPQSADDTLFLVVREAVRKQSALWDLHEEIWLALGGAAGQRPPEHDVLFSILMDLAVCAPRYRRSHYDKLIVAAIKAIAEHDPTALREAQKEVWRDLLDDAIEPIRPS